MKKLLLVIFLSGFFIHALAQADTIVYHGTFKKAKAFMHSNPYKPDNWEKPYFERAIKSAFPSDLQKYPETYAGKLIHLLGIVESVYFETKDGATMAVFLLENKYWDYVEDYSIQDEIMFVSEKGDGKFLVAVKGIDPEQVENIRQFAQEKKLFLVYGDLQNSTQQYPYIVAHKVKYIDYDFYTTKVFSYEIKRDKKGNVVTDKSGKIQLTNYNFLKVAKGGQNK